MGTLRGQHALYIQSAKSVGLAWRTISPLSVLNVLNEPKMHVRRHGTSEDTETGFEGNTI
jgi:hypothetical protein